MLLRCCSFHVILTTMAKCPSSDAAVGSTSSPALPCSSCRPLCRPIPPQAVHTDHSSAHNHSHQGTGRFSSSQDEQASPARLWDLATLLHPVGTSQATRALPHKEKSPSECPECARYFPRRDTIGQ
ncbi:hypothetical protein EDB81DRAFT_130066 [Dactylonectria macrodidyma]|uniref:Uncharacterized protein n=1 Tax=Dactylonectria macrodidyma TaxID=307937 RepID=A0A9P9E5I0_9HYPO|nr:hypothetical protein EDB81DRAFT_130066 [Dactylonectria macrodidyma]